MGSKDSKRSASSGGSGDPKTKERKKRLKVRKHRSKSGAVTLPLSGRVAFITGGSRGQGRAHALALAAEGADIVLCDIAADIATVPYPLGTKKELEETRGLVEASGRACLALVADVRDTAAMADVVAAGLDRFGHIDICVANAGITGFAKFQDLDDDIWQDMIDVDLTGVFKTIRAVLPHMLERRYGRIVATSSMAGRMGNPNLAHYVAAKWGVIGLVKTLAMETANKGITVNAICPAAVDTPMLHNPAMYSLFCPDLAEPGRDDVAPRYASMNRMGIPWLEPEEISRAVTFLCADAASGMTGQVIEVSLGSSAGQH
jgi:SDR family mycofactocin-dependent oxidoreductase